MFPVSSLVAFGGSRGLSGSGLALASRVASVLFARGASLSVGCAPGADAAAVSVAVSVGALPRLWVFAVGGSDGVGFLPGFRPPFLSLPVGRVSWFAGGPLCVPLRVRLAARSRGVVRVARSAAVFVVSGGEAASPGSWGALRFAAFRGLPCFVVPVGAPALVPLASSGGSWVPCSSLSGLVGSASFRWVPR